MQVLYKSTRGKEEAVTASMAILKGLSEDGGLFVPTEIPKLDVPMDKLAQMSYQETAYEVMKRFLTDFTEEELKNCISRAYDDKFDTKTIAPLHEADGVYFLELYHGATIAFKDMALSILPHLMTTAAKSLIRRVISFLRQTLSISDVWFRRSYIMYMHMHPWSARERSRMDRRSISQFLQETLEISLLHIMQSRWVFLYIS